MECPNCNYEMADPMEECEYKITDSGSSHNMTFGQPESWFYADLTCPKCSHIFEYTDSSL